MRVIYGWRRSFYSCSGAKSEALLSFISRLLYLSQAYKPGQTLTLPKFMRMFSFIPIKIIHICHSCEMISRWMLPRHHMKGDKGFNCNEQIHVPLPRSEHFVSVSVRSKTTAYLLLQQMFGSLHVFELSCVYSRCRQSEVRSVCEAVILSKSAVN